MTTGPGLLLPAAAALHAAPAVTARGALGRLLPRLSGVGRPGGVALTFDDGPDPDGTPAVLDTLADLGWSATFFLLGTQVRRYPQVARLLVAQGHEVALHGDTHRNHLLRAPVAVHRDLVRGRASVSGVTGVRPRWFRPPYGVLTTAGLAAARRLGLTPVLWTAWGRDWLGGDPRRVADTVLHDLRDGGTVLLHDSDVTSRPGSWRATAAALPLLAGSLADRGWQVRRLDGHLVPRPRRVAPT